MLSTISKREKDIALKSLEALLDKRIINKLRNEKYQDIKSSKNFYTSFRILTKRFVRFNLEKSLILSGIFSLNSPLSQEL